MADIAPPPVPHARKMNSSNHSSYSCLMTNWYHHLANVFEI